MKDENVTLAEVRLHPEYIRHRKNTEYISQLASDLSDAGKWIFPPIELQPIASTEKVYAEGGRYYILDGTNRVSAAIEIKWASKIPARIHLPMTAVEAIAVQVRTNNTHGLRLSVSDQTAAIKRMAELGMEGKKIAKEAGISPSSVSRIVKDKQRATETGEAGNVVKPKTPKPFKADDWLKSLNRVLKGYAKHGSKIRKAGFPAECQKAVDVLVSNLIDKTEE
jgi:ParB-like chromosome segregation protein Spo0J